MTFETATYDIQCQANRGCYGSSILVQYGVLGEGAYANALGTIIKEPSQRGEYHVTCDGKAGCYKASVTTDSMFWVGAYYGAFGASVTAALVEAGGYLAMAYSTIEGSGPFSGPFTEVDHDLELRMTGHLSGYKAKVTCRAGQSCSILCQGSACYDMDLICMDGSDCSVTPRACSSGAVTSGDTACPNMLTTDTQRVQKEVADGDTVYAHIHWLVQQDDAMEADVHYKVDQREYAQRTAALAEFFAEIGYGHTASSSLFDDASVMIGCAALVVAAMMVYVMMKHCGGQKQYMEIE